MDIYPNGRVFPREPAAVGIDGADLDAVATALDTHFDGIGELCGFSRIPSTRDDFGRHDLDG